MPGKTSQSNRKQDSSKERVSSSQTQLGEAAGRKIPIWPEWTEAELAAEKWVRILLRAAHSYLWY